jgi:hypothetical protein
MTFNTQPATTIIIITTVCFGTGAAAGAGPWLA